MRSPGTSREALLGEYLARCSKDEFSWKNHNCTHFAGEWVRLVEGWDPLSTFNQDMPENVRQAARLLDRLGGFQETVTERLRRPHTPWQMSLTGDIVLLREGMLRGALGLCNGSTAAFLAPHGGIAFLPLNQVACSWPVGVGS